MNVLCTATAAAMLLAAVGLETRADQVTFSWDQSVSGDWTDPARWTANVLTPATYPDNNHPDAPLDEGHVAHIVGAAAPDHTIVLDLNPTIDRLRIDSPNATFSATGRALVVLGPADIFAGKVAWNSSTWSADLLHIRSDVTTTIAGPSSITTPTFLQRGVLRIDSSAAAATLTVSGAMSNTGTIVLEGSSNMQSRLLISSGHTLTNAPQGNITVAAIGSGIHALSGTVHNQGTIDLFRNTNLVGSLTNDGEINIAPTVNSARVMGTLTNTGTINNQGTLNLNLAGIFPPTAELIHNSGALTSHRIDVIGGVFTHNGGAYTSGTVFINGGTVNLNAGVTPGDYHLRNSATLNLNATTTAATYLMEFQGNTLNPANPFVLTGGFNLPSNGASSSGGAEVTVSGGFTNQGLIELHNTVSFAGVSRSTLTVTGGAITNDPAGRIWVRGHAVQQPHRISADIDNLGTIDLDRDVSFTKSDGTYSNSGEITVGPNAAAIVSGSSFTNSGDITVAGALTLHTSYLQLSPGQLILNGGTVTSTHAGGFDINGGTVRGSGTLVGNVLNAGTISPGHSAGTLNITGNLAMFLNSNVVIDLGGTAPGTQHDQILVSGNALLNGELTVQSIGGFIPLPGQGFQIMTFNSRSGAFGQIVNETSYDGLWFETEYDAQSLTVRAAAIAGDANLDGVVNIADLSILASNWQQSGATWLQADFTGEGVVNIADLSLLASNWQSSVAGMSLAEAMAMFDVFGGVVIPEPAGISLIGLAGLMARRRRRKGTAWIEAAGMR